MATAQVALDSARTYLNDVGGSLWTNTILVPFLKEAHRDMELSLWLNGIPVLREKSAAINVTAVSGLTLTLPGNFVEPIWLKERAQGSLEDWIPMTETDFEPDFRQDTTLRYWAFREEAINFVGATTAREVLLRYWKSLTTLVDGTTNLQFVFSEYFLGPQCAGYAAKSLGNITLAEENFEIAKTKWDMILRANIKGMQNLPAKRIPYRRFARSRLLL